ncbi:MAG: T9SS type A sorting domain-containing protein [Bacteroidetes bacterium]|nr:T9SS type A sorting domain-containing protein [Bacteroidota bacterium]
MKIGHYIAVLICLLVFNNVVAQKRDVAGECATSKINQYKSLQKTTIASAEENNYDVKHVKIDVSVSNTSGAISGCVTTTAKATALVMPVYVFELDTIFTIDSVLVNAQPCVTANDKNIRKAILPTAITQGNTFVVHVYYHGEPTPPGNGYYKRGLNNVKADPWGSQITYTLSEPFMANEWWPCKQSLTDKIDSADIWITVPSNLKAGSNGVLKNITVINTIQNRYEWHTAYPIDYYLLSIAVGPFTDYSYKVKLPVITDSLLVQNYLYDAAGALSFYKAGIDSAAQMLQYFSDLFGVYPFYKEKYGHCIVPLPGGMEYQTMTTCGNADPYLISHELAHQWFGDYVTCAGWQDVWLNEGFASYAEYLFAAHFRGDKEAADKMNEFHERVLDDTFKTGTVYVDDTTDEYRIFNGKLSYAKAAAVIHTLRYVIHNDSVFFSVLKKYQQQYAFSVATTNDFKVLAEQLTNRNLDTFFSQWIFKEGYPIYRNEWNQIKDDIYIRLYQASILPKSVPLYYTPVEIQLIALDGDTTFTVYNNTNAQDVHIKWSKKLRDVVIDPNNYILNVDLGCGINPELGINEVISSEVKVFPNPADEYWSVIGIPLGSDIIITDELGRKIMAFPNATTTGRVIYIRDLIKGVYFLHVLKGKTKIQSVKLVKY